MWNSSPSSHSPSSTPMIAHNIQYTSRSGNLLSRRRLSENAPAEGVPDASKTLHQENCRLRLVSRSFGATLFPSCGYSRTTWSPPRRRRGPDRDEHARIIRLERRVGGSSRAWHGARAPSAEGGVQGVAPLITSTSSIAHQLTGPVSGHRNRAFACNAHVKCTGQLGTGARDVGMRARTAETDGTDESV